MAPMTVNPKTKTKTNKTETNSAEAMLKTIALEKQEVSLNTPLTNSTAQQTQKQKAIIEVFGSMPADDEYNYKEGRR